MKIGLHQGYWQKHPTDRFIELAQKAEKLGFDSVFTAEAYGSDCFTPLAAIAAHTSSIRLCTGVMQISARTPVCAGMTALTLDHIDFKIGITFEQLDTIIQRTAAVQNRQ